MLPDPSERAALLRRREHLARALGGAPAVMASSRPRPRNYAADQFPFRAASHFLYLFGLAAPDGMGVYDGEAWTLYLPDPGPDDALWDGEVPGFAEVSERTGCPVRSRSALPEALARAAKARAVATLPTPDLETCADLAALLGREVRPGRLLPQDVPLADAMVALRLRHDDVAQAQLRRAAEATTPAHLAGMRATRPGVLEAVVRAAMEAEFVSRDVRPAYQPIVTVHGEVLHNLKYHHVLREGDLLLADVGGESPGGFACDVTRTWPVTGRFSTTQRELYEVVLCAQKASIAAVRPGVRYRDVHLAAHREMARGLVALGILHGDPEELVVDGLTALLFPHGIGHLLGLDVHDMEDLGDRAGYAPGRERSKEFGHRYLRLDRDLEPGMAVTIEPGLYRVPAILGDARLTARAGDRLDRAVLERYSDVRGIRIEDDVLVTAEGHEVLTAAIPKEASDVEAAVMAGR
ncbi:aminopeptidase P family protein [Pyxidicoccus fallax]|uniref:Xaa-Pro aminopeptidase n=1 Tax=Pyxidicoccus fallax TaxID=394095 RepID=A0A848LCN4_9BACT|nr:aminopeptidase P family protein [Pyxidicoccus fallax]NMO14503.1 aminopeptidase P family protein [Pyxidicoccus fallax]NPC83683.1 aminopeptidase P family protein [Pyxidicoccus fallax]